MGEIQENIPNTTIEDESNLKTKKRKSMRTLETYVSLYKSNQRWNQNKTNISMKGEQYMLLIDNESIGVFQG